VDRLELSERELAQLGLTSLSFEGKLAAPVSCTCTSPMVRASTERYAIRWPSRLRLTE